MKILKHTLWLPFLLLLTACQTTIIAPYDADVRNLLVRSNVKVEMFWQNMQAQDATKRQYQQYAHGYQEIEVDLKVLLMLNKMRPNNSESVKQSENLLTLWLEDKAKHQQKDGFKDFLLKRRVDQYKRVFDAMLTAEDAKDI